MILEYINAALEKAKYEIIEDDEPYYGEVPGLKGVWATGKTLEECRRNLAEIIEGWIIIRLKRGFEGPFSGGRHPYMIKGNLVLAIPNPHKKEISVTCYPAY